MRVDACSAIAWMPGLGDCGSTKQAQAAPANVPTGRRALRLKPILKAWVPLKCRLVILFTGVNEHLVASYVFFKNVWSDRRVTGLVRVISNTINICPQHPWAQVLATCKGQLAYQLQPWAVRDCYRSLYFWIPRNMYT